MAAAALLALWTLTLLFAVPARAQSSCVETGAGLPYRGTWGALSYQDRVARCQEAERRQQEREDRARERDAVREDRARERDAAREGRRPAPADRSSAESRQQECLVNAAACDTGTGTTSGGGGEPSSSSRRPR